jgi:hypothetical protein
MKYIKCNTLTGAEEEITVDINANTVFDISQDDDDTHYKFDSFEDYKYFSDHAILE